MKRSTLNKWVRFGPKPHWLDTKTGFDLENARRAERAQRLLVKLNRQRYGSAHRMSDNVPIGVHAQRAAIAAQIEPDDG